MKIITNLRDKVGVSGSVWDFYNPKLYFKQMVQFEDEKRYKGKNLYETKPLKVEKMATHSPFKIGSLFLSIMP